MPDPSHLHLRCRLNFGALHMDLDFKATKPWTVVFGPSGSGKSTLLRVIAGLQPSDEASLTLRGENLTGLPAHKRHIALVAQQPSIFPHLTVRENVAFARTDRGANVDPILRNYRLLHVADGMPAAISGGEGQRTALARAVQAAPRVLLLDEVFTGMQNSLRTELIAQLRAEQAASTHGLQILSVTHDVAEALTCADEVVTMDGGRIIDQGDPARVLARERVALLLQLG